MVPGALSAESVGVGYHTAFLPTGPCNGRRALTLATANQNVSNAGGERTRIFILDTRNTSLSDIKYAAAHYHVHALGSLWLMDRAEPPAPLDGYAMDEREPSWWQWLWLGPVEPVRRVRWSPWVTWEWRTLLGQPVAPPPQTEPPTTRRDSASLTTWRSSEATRRRPRRCARASSRRSTCGAGPPSTATRRCSGGVNTAARRGLRCISSPASSTSTATSRCTRRSCAPPRLSTAPRRYPPNLELASRSDANDKLWRKGHIYPPRDHLPEATRHRGPDRRLEPGPPPHRQRTRAPGAASLVMRPSLLPAAKKGAPYLRPCRSAESARH